MTFPLTREQAQAAATSASAERDTIQANILELDGSFGKRLLAGATPDRTEPGDSLGADRRGPGRASGDIPSTAYSAVIDRASRYPQPARPDPGRQGSAKR